MRRIILCLTTVVLVSVTAPAVQALQKHYYRGRTSDGGSVRIVTSGRASGLTIHSISFGTPQRTWECPSDDRETFRGLTSIWPHGGRVIGDDRTFSRNVEIEGFIDYHLRGTVGPQQADGTFAFTWLETGCTTGDLTWHAHRTDPLTRSLATQRQPGWRTF